MPGAPLAGRSVEFQVAVSGLGMILYEKPADLDNAVVVSSDTEVHGIGAFLSVGRWGQSFAYPMLQQRPSCSSEGSTAAPARCSGL